MARLTKFDIERRLLAGLPVVWSDGSKKPPQMLLGDPKARSIFEFLLSSPVRNPTGLPNAFIDGLAKVYENGTDPAIQAAASAASPGSATTWRLKRIETEGFGGVNTWNGPVFNFDFDGESMLIEGPNGSGKSSLTGAILWALTGECPRDQVDGDDHKAKPVYRADDRSLVGEWPPLACYPATAVDLKTLPRVRVMLEFVDDAGSTAKVERTLEHGVITRVIDPTFVVPSVFIETGILMPARLAILKLGAGSGRLTDAVQMLTGMDDLAAIGGLVDGLCHKGREYLSTKNESFRTKPKISITTSRRRVQP